jgi:hypothetical protein
MHGPRLLGPFIKFHQGEVGQSFERMQHLKTPTLGFTNCPIDSSISCNVKELWELQATDMQSKIAMSSSSISYNIFSSLDVHVK